MAEETLRIVDADTWPQALTILAQPQNTALCIRLLGNAVDEIWHAAGDTSTDLSW